MAIPTNIKKLKGTFQQCRAVENEMETTLVKASSEIDRNLFINDAAFNEWERIFKELSSTGILMVTDLTALLMLCNDVGIYMACITIIKNEGLNSITPNGHKQQRPEVSTMMKVKDSYFKSCSKFGLTPTDRMKIETPKSHKEDPFADFLN